MNMKIIALILVFVFSATAQNVRIPQIKPGQPLPVDLFIQIGKKIQPAVVNISTTVNASSTSSFLYNPFDLLDPFSKPQESSSPRDHSLGSGFIIEKNGLIVTNAHVIDQADTINVHIKDDPTVYKASVIGKDRLTDIALIKVDIKDSRTRKAFSTVELGDSNKLQVGEWVVAFGNPFGHSNTMTKGIISAIDRHIDELNLLPFLQTDASINPGNSGGPLVNTKGQVIGVNTAINPRAQNIGFAIPIFNVRSILKSLKTHGYVKRGFLGVQMNIKSVEFDYKGASYSGVLIENVVKGSPANKGGIRPNDIIVKFNGSPMNSSRDLAQIVSSIPVNEKVKVELFRGKRMRTLDVVIKERPRPNAKKIARRVQKKDPNKAPYALGFSIVQANSETARNFNLPTSYINRPIVFQVRDNSPASRAKLMKGDIIFSVNGKSVQTTRDVLDQVRTRKLNILQVLRFDQPGRYSLKKIVIKS